jgi:hypothetical protein
MVTNLYWSCALNLITHTYGPNKITFKIFKLKYCLTNQTEFIVTLLYLLPPNQHLQRTTF